MKYYGEKGELLNDPKTIPFDRFEKLVTYQRENGEYLIDFGKFHNVFEVDMPECSAKELDEIRVSYFNKHLK
jgi:hypothetical protein